MSRVALITGGQQGIGLGIARALRDAGYALALAAEQSPDAPAVRAALADLGAGARYFRHDVQDVAGVPALLDQVEASLGPVTTLVSNAGVPARVRGDLLDVTPDSFDFVLGVNLRGGFFLAQAVAARMQGQPAGPYRSLIFITSVSAEMASTSRAEYCISKAGAAMMAKLFALRLAPLGIGVFELRPGIIETAMTAGVAEQYAARIADGLVPAMRWGQPGDIGSVVVPLAQGQFAFATGAVIAVDGGLSIARL
ncbi:MAG: 3-ketoacyl-ACP reductase [Pseudorhodobacter sp.]|nr:3-ketoacyl-ACP reductase [Pseudorhodobacter sp.]